VVVPAAVPDLTAARAELAAWRVAEARAVATEYFIAHGRAVRREARETMELLKSLHIDVYHELLDAVLE